MQYRLMLSFSLSFACWAPAFSAEPVPLQHTPFSEVKKIFHPQRSAITQDASSPMNELHLLNQHIDRKKVIHARMQQFYLGFPVMGGYAVMHTKQSVRHLWTSAYKPASMNGVVFKGLFNDLGTPFSHFEENAQVALQHFKSQFADQHLTEEKVRPVIYMDENHIAHWAYQVSVLITYDTKIPERPTAIVDAKTFEPFVKWNDIKGARSTVNGRGFSGNKLTGLQQYGVDLPLLSITRNDITSICYMENSWVKVVDMMHRYEGRNQTMHFLCDDSSRQNDGSFLTGYKGTGYDKINGAYSPSNDALRAGTVIYDMYKNWFDMSPLEENGKVKKLLMRVHFGSRYENAFWDGEQMTFGDGGALFYPLVSVGIGAHEISHGFTEQHSDLIYFGQSGGMNESFSDMASQAAEFYATGKNSWKIGDDVVKPESGITAFRFMDSPSLDGHSIDNADQYTDEMDVHYTSGVYNRLFYLLATTPGWDVRKAFIVMLTANADYWIPTSTFDEGACGIIDAARSYNFSIGDVKHVLDQVGVKYSACYSDEGALSV